MKNQDCLSIKDKLYAVIDMHCCTGCDGYNCPNGGEGLETLDTTEKLIDVFNELIKEYNIYWYIEGGSRT